jgi:hypothetical protein
VDFSPSCYKAGKNRAGKKGCPSHGKSEELVKVVLSSVHFWQTGDSCGPGCPCWEGMYLTWVHWAGAWGFQEGIETKQDSGLLLGARTLVTSVFPLNYYASRMRYTHSHTHTHTHSHTQGGRSLLWGLFLKSSLALYAYTGRPWRWP